MTDIQPETVPDDTASVFSPQREFGANKEFVEGSSSMPMEVEDLPLELDSREGGNAVQDGSAQFCQMHTS